MDTIIIFFDCKRVQRCWKKQENDQIVGEIENEAKIELTLVS